MYQLSVIVSSYNRSKLLLETLESIIKQDCPPADYELIIINNNSTDDTDEMVNAFVARYPDHHIRYYIETQQGLSFARNRGITSAGAPLLVLFDDDLIVEPDVLGKIMAHFRSEPRLSAAGGKIIPRFLAPKPNWYGKYFWGLVGHVDYGDQVRSYPGSRYPAGAFLIFRKEVFEQYGLFDTQLGRKGTVLMANEEKDLFARLRKNNALVYFLPDIKVHHAVESNKFDQDYVKRHSKGIGISERLRMERTGGSILIKFLEYVAKLGYAIAYGMLYLLQGQYPKFRMLVLFRWWVLLGFINKK